MIRPPALMVLLVAALLVAAGCDKKRKAGGSRATGSAHVVRLTVAAPGQNSHTLRLRLRATWAQRHRPPRDITAGGHQGLLVAFPRARALGISPNTADAPLDVVLLDDDRKVLRVAPRVAPTTSRRVDVIPNLYRYALLLPAGAAAKAHLKAGVPTQFDLPPWAHPRKVLTAVTLSPARGSAVTVLSELAMTPEETAFGLMYRRFLPARGGMIFRFPRPQILQFYMRNTRVPLDMIFINDHRVVTGVVHRAKPFDETNVGVGPLRNRYVLEVRAGFARKHHIAAGTAVTFRLPE